MSFEELEEKFAWKMALLDNDLAKLVKMETSTQMNYEIFSVQGKGLQRCAIMQQQDKPDFVERPWPAGIRVHLAQSDLTNPAATLDPSN